MRCSTPRTASRYSDSFVRSLCGSAALQVRDLLATESSTLRCWRSRVSRTSGSVLVLSPNRRSNTTRGLFCVGSGVLRLFQLIVFV